MIIDEYVKVKTTNKNIGLYRKIMNDPNIKSGYIITLSILKLPKGSKQLIDVKCDVCGKNKKMSFRTYYNITNKNSEKYFCKDCKWVKTKQTNLEKYGVENPFQNEKIKDKIKITNIEKFGFDHPLKNEQIKNKRRKTELEKYGFDHHLKNKLILNKLKQTNLEKYGNECSLLNNEVKLKTIKTNIERYGVDVPLKNKDIINKLIETNNLKYNNNSPLQNEEIREKSLKKLFENFGVYNPLKSDIIKNKVKNTKINNLLCKYKDLNIVNIDYDNQQYEFRCDNNNNHNFLISSILLYDRLKFKTILCTVCNPINSYSISGQEIQLQNIIKENYTGNIILNDRKIIKPYELDVYLPDLKLAFEYNGLFRHNEMGKSNDYHLNKTESCEKQGIHLIHIYEDDWVYKQEIVKSRILNLLGKTSNEILSEKCEIKNFLDNSLIKEFLENNHLQGFIESKIKLGLFYNNELVSVMIFKRRKNIYEILRFCNKLNTNIIGSENKLFKYFVETYKPKEITGYSDRSWCDDLYEKQLGFILVDKTKPNYHYIVDGVRKQKMIKENKTEHEIMLERKIYRIYDSGSLKFKYINEKINK